MKSFSSLIFALLLGLFVTACGGNSSAAAQDTHEGHDHATEATAEAPHGEGKEYTSAYVCPMHCQGSGSEEAGACPVCGMDYVAQADHTSNGHSH